MKTKIILILSLCMMLMMAFGVSAATLEFNNSEMSGWTYEDTLLEDSLILLNYTAIGEDRTYVEDGNFISTVYDLGLYKGPVMARWIKQYMLTLISSNVALEHDVSCVNSCNTLPQFDETHLVDGDASTGALTGSSSTFPKSFTIDLGLSYNITNVTLDSVSTAQYRANLTGIFVSDDDITYRQVGENQTFLDTAGEKVYTFPNTIAQYVQIRVFSSSGTTNFVGFDEAYIEGILVATPLSEHNYAFEQDVSCVTCHSLEMYDETHLVDGDISTEALTTSSSTFPKSFTIDLGTVNEISQVTLDSIYTTQYRANLTGIFVSDDDITYRQVGENLTFSDTAGEKAYNFPETTARYVQIRVFSGNGITNYVGFNQAYVKGPPQFKLEISQSSDGSSWSDWTQLPYSDNSTIENFNKEYIKFKGNYNYNDNDMFTPLFTGLELDYGTYINIISWENQEVITNADLIIETSDLADSVDVYVNSTLVGTMNQDSTYVWSLDINSDSVIGNNNLSIIVKDVSSATISTSTTSYIYFPESEQLTYDNFTVITLPDGSINVLDNEENILLNNIETVIEFGHNVAYKRPVSTTAKQSSYSIEAINDGDTTPTGYNVWMSTNTPTFPKVINIELNQEYTINKVKMFGGETINYRPENYSIFVSDDNVSFTEVGDSTMSSATGYVFDEVTFPEVTAKYVEVRIYSKYNPSYSNFTEVDEIEIYQPVGINTLDMIYTDYTKQISGDKTSLIFTMGENPLVDIVHTFDIYEDTNKIEFIQDITYNSPAYITNEISEFNVGGDDAHYWSQRLNKLSVPESNKLLTKWAPHNILIENDGNYITISDIDHNLADDVEISFSDNVLNYSKYLFKNESHIMTTEFSSVSSYDVKTGYNRLTSDTSSVGTVFKFHDTLPKQIIKNNYPYFFDGGFMIMEHADQSPDDWGTTGAQRREVVMFGSNDSNSEFYSKKGLIGHNILAELGVWTYGNSDTLQGLSTHADYKEIFDKLVYDYGYDVELHGKITSGNMQSTASNISYLKDLYGSNFRSWIDHGPGSYCQTVIKNGANPEHECYIMDIFSDNDIDYVWGFNSGQAGLPNLAGNAVGNSAGIAFQEGTNGIPVVITTGMYTAYVGPSASQIASVISNKGLILDHSYLVAGNLPNHWYEDEGTIVINDTFEEMLVRLEAAQDAEKLWIPYPARGLDWMHKKQRVSIEPSVEGVRVTNNNGDTITGVMVINENPIESAKLSTGNYLIYVDDTELVLPELSANSISEIEITEGSYLSTLPRLIHVDTHLDVLNAVYDTNGDIRVVVVNTTKFDIYNKTLKINNPVHTEYDILDNGQIIAKVKEGEIISSNGAYNITISGDEISFMLPHMSEHEIIMTNTLPDNIVQIDACHSISETVYDSFNLGVVAILVLVAALIIGVLTMGFGGTANFDASSITATITIVIVSAVIFIVGIIVYAKVSGAIC